MTNPDFDHPYSDAVKVGDLIFLSGCLPVDKDDNLVEGPAALDAALGKVHRRLKEYGLDLSNVAKMTYFVTDIGERAAINEQYTKTWDEPRPARTVIGVASLPRNASVEIDVIAKASD